MLLADSEKKPVTGWVTTHPLKVIPSDSVISVEKKVFFSFSFASPIGFKIGTMIHIEKEDTEKKCNKRCRIV